MQGKALHVSYASLEGQYATFELEPHMFQVFASKKIPKAAKGERRAAGCGPSCRPALTP